MRYQAPYTVFKRTLPSGRKIYYYQLRLPDGRRSPAYSTGQTRKDKAYQVAAQASQEAEQKTAQMTLADFCQNWFIWEKCPYITSKLRAGGHYSRSQADLQRRWLERFILPYLGHFRLSTLRPRIIESWLTTLEHTTGHSPTSLHHYGKTLSVILSEAERLDVIEKSPMKQVRLPAKADSGKGIYTDEEISQLFKQNNWRNRTHLLINLLAYSTGMRMGELQALQWDSVHEDHIVVRRSWDRKYGLKTTKSGKTRVIPISIDLHTKLQGLRCSDSLQSTFLFPNTTRKAPIDHKAIRANLRAAQFSTGLNADEIKLRRLTFHTWRHQFITEMSRTMRREDVQKIVGHASNDVTNLYDHSLANFTKSLEERQNRFSVIAKS